MLIASLSLFGSWSHSNGDPGSPLDILEVSLGGSSVSDLAEETFDFTNFGADLEVFGVVGFAFHLDVLTDEGGTFVLGDGHQLFYLIQQVKLDSGSKDVVSVFKVENEILVALLVEFCMLDLADVDDACGVDVVREENVGLALHLGLSGASKAVDIED